MCLLGSVVIVLHAPPDKPVERIDEILHYALQPGMLLGSNERIAKERPLTLSPRIPFLLPCSGHLLDRHDLPSRTVVRKEEPAHLHFDLLDCWLRLGHVCQGIRYCLEAHIGRSQPIHSALDLRLCHRHWILHFNADELFQQGIEPVLYIDVSKTKKKKLAGRRAMLMFDTTASTLCTT